MHYDDPYSLSQDEKQTMIKAVLTALDQEEQKRIFHDWSTLPQQIGALSHCTPAFLRVMIRFCGSACLLYEYVENEEGFSYSDLSSLGYYVVFGDAGRAMDALTTVLYKSIFRYGRNFMK